MVGGIKRKFDGKEYNLFTWEDTKAEAESEALGLRQHGRWARVVKGVQKKPKRRVWCVYIRERNPL